MTSGVPEIEGSKKRAMGICLTGPIGLIICTFTSFTHGLRARGRFDKSYNCKSYSKMEKLAKICVKLKVVFGFQQYQ
jgi:hypothetical protein